MGIEVGIGEVVSAAKVSSGALVSGYFDFANMSITARKIIFDGDAFVANVALDTSIRTVFVFMFEPIAPAKLYAGTTVALDVGAVNALVWDEVLSLHHLPAFGVWTLEMAFRAVFGRMLLDKDSRQYLFTVFIWTSNFEVVAHIHY